MKSLCFLTFLAIAFGQLFGSDSYYNNKGAGINGDFSSPGFTPSPTSSSTLYIKNSGTFAVSTKGAVSVTSLVLGGDGSNPTLVVAADTSLSLSSILGTALSVSGANIIVQSGATLSVSGATSLSGIVNVMLADATAKLTADSLTVNGNLTVSGTGSLTLKSITTNLGGTINLNSQINIAPSLLGGTLGFFLGVGDVNIGGKIVASGNLPLGLLNNKIVFQSGAIISSTTGALVTFASSVTIAGDVQATTSVAFNAGFTQTAGLFNATSVQIGALVPATVSIANGASFVASSSLKVGLATTFNVASGAIIDLHGASVTVSAASSFLGSGYINLDGAIVNADALTNFATTVNISATTQLLGAGNFGFNSGANVVGSATLSLDDFIIASGQSITLGVNALFNSLKQIDGSLTVSGSATFNNGISLSAGASLLGGLGALVTIGGNVNLKAGATFNVSAFAFNKEANVTAEAGAIVDLRGSSGSASADITFSGLGSIFLGLSTSVQSSNRITFEGPVSVSGDVSLAVDGSGKAVGSVFFFGSLKAEAGANVNALVNFASGSSISGSADITFSSHVEFQSSANVNASVLISTDVKFNANATVQGTVKVDGSAQVVVSEYLTLSAGASVAASASAKLNLGARAVLYASGTATVSQRVPLALTADATLYAEEGATLTIDSAISVSASGNMAANFYGNIVVNADLVASALANIRISGTSSIVSVQNADFSVSSSLAIFASASANMSSNSALSSRITASGNIVFDGSVTLGICGLIDTDVQAVVIANYNSRTGTFASVNVQENLQASVCASANVGVNNNRAILRDGVYSKGYTVQYNQNQAVARKTDDVSSGSIVAYTLAFAFALLFA